MYNVVEAARVTYVTQFCVSVCIRVSVTYISDDKKTQRDPRDQRDPVSFSRPGHICDQILCICVYLCPIVYRVTYVTQLCVSVCICVL